MNFRKILDWRKALIYTHRWTGIVFGLLFLSWFVSGIAFMYWGLPSLSAKERLDHQQAVDLSTATVAPAEAAKTHGIKATSLRIEMRGDRPVYRMGNSSVFADTGEVINALPVDADRAAQIVREWVPEKAEGVRYDARLEDSDQWTLQNAQRNQMPLHRIAVGDSEDTYYYVAEKTGAIVMKTDRVTRFKGFLSGVLHWVYFTPLRRHSEAWNQFIIWGSFAGAFMCLAGLAIGIWRLSPAGRFRQKGQPSHSPYMGLMRWHHYTGLVFGLISFTWVISGAFSVNPFGMFSRERGGNRAEREAVTGGSLKLKSITVESLQASLAAIRQTFAPKEIEIQQFRGDLYMTANRPPESEAREQAAEYRMVWLAHPESGTFTKFDDKAIEQIADEIVGDSPVQDRAWLTEYDNYYRSRTGSRPLPVLRVRLMDENRTWLYLDPHRGAVTQEVSSSRSRRWLYAALHEFDWPFLYNNRPLWDITVILFSVGGIVLSASTLWPSVKRLYRHSKRLAFWRPGPAPQQRAAAANMRSSRETR